MPIDPIVEVDALVARPTLLLLDVRDAKAFEARHPDGAVRVPIENWVALAKGADTSFENTAFWEERIRELGVTADVDTAVYDDGRMTEASRVWFILQYFGANAVIVNGGWPALADRCDAFGGCVGGNVPFEARAGQGHVGLVDRHALKNELDDVAVFDSRTRAEHHGEDLKNNARGGRLPGARLLAHGDLLEGGRLKSPAELHRLIDDTGFQPGDRIVTHCDGGGRAALAAVAALRAGYDDVRVYYLSFSDWAKDESCPIEPGPGRN